MHLARPSTARMGRFIFAATALLFTAGAARAADFQVLIDLDNQLATGCNAVTPGGTFGGIEQILTATVTPTGPASANVTALTLETCSGGFFGAPVPVNSPIAPPWPVGVGLGDLGNDVVETYLPTSMLAIADPQTIRIVVVGATGPQAPGDSASGILVLAAIAEIPVLDRAGLLLLSVLLIGAAILVLRRGGAAAVAILLLLAGAGAVWAVCLLDGDPSDWSLANRIALDPAGDVPPGGDIVSLYAKQDNCGGADSLCFRVDADLVFSQPPVAVADTAAVAEDAAATPIDVMANDTDPDGGTNVVQSVTQPANGTVVITNSGADLTYAPNTDYCNTPPGTTLDTFTYTLNGGSSATVTVTVTCVNDPPSFVKGPDVTVLEDAGAQVINPWATAISPGPPDEAGQTVNFITGNNNPALFLLQPVVTSSGVLAFTPLPGASGTANLTVTAQDSLGAMSATQTAVINVTVVDDPPTAVADNATVGEDSGATPIPVLLNDTDTDGGQLNVASVTQPANGTVVNNTTDVSYTPNPNYCNAPPGTTLDTFTYTLNGGSTATVTVTVTCVDDDPTAAPDTATVGEDSGANTINVLANDSDPDGGPPFTIASVTQPANGVVVNNTTDLSYAPNADYCNNPPGTTLDTFTYTLTPGGSSTTVTVTVTCADDNPVAVNDSPTVVEDSGATAIDVLANDTDPDGGPMSINSVTQPANGAVLITGGGTGLTYAPNANYCNTMLGGSPDIFTYTLTPGGSSATVSVTVTCVDDDPVAVVDTATVNEDSGANVIDVLANDTDIDGGPRSVISVTQPASGTVVNNSTNVSYAPNPNYCNNPPGTTLDTFSYTLTPGGSSTTVTVTVTCLDDGPVIDLDANDDKGSAGADFAVTFTEGDTAKLLEDPADATITDVDSANVQTLTVTLTNLLDPTFEVLDANLTAFPSISKTYVVDTVPTPDTGTLTLTGPDLVANFQAVLRTVTYVNTDADPDATARVITFVANDGAANGNTATATVTIVPVDVAPTAVADSPTVNEDSGASTIDVLANDTDPDGGPKSVTSVTQPANGTVVNNTTNVSYAPNPNYCNNPPGTTLDTFDYTITGGSSATVTVTVTCVDDNPTAVADSATVGEDSGANAIDVLANDTDADGGTKLVNTVQNPSAQGGTVLITGGGTGVTYAPAANYCNNPPGTTLDTFTYALTPGGSTATVTVTVTCVDDNPVAVNDSATVVEDSVANTINVLANDTDVDGGSKSISLVTQPANGTVVITNGGADLTYAPNGNYCNTPPPFDTFTYTLTPGGSVATVSVTVTCVDDPPTAVTDSATVLEDSGATAVGVLANDTDIDGGPKSIQSVTQPTNGAVVITGGGTGLTYAPNGNYCNNPPGTTPDTFTYTLMPGGSVATVSMTVTCVNDAPVLTDTTPNYTAIGNTQLRAGATPPVIAAVANTTDASNALAKAGPITDVDGPGPIEVVPATGASANGGTFNVQADGDFTYHPPAGFTGTDTFVVQITDNGAPAGFAPATVTVAVSELVWYVKNNTATAGIAGTSVDPMNTLNEAEVASTTDDYIYVFQGDGTNAGQNVGITLKNGQKLLGEGVNLVVSAITLVTGNPANKPLVSHTTNNAVTVLANTVNGDRANIEIRGLSLSTSASTFNAIDATSANAANLGVTISDNAITGAPAEGIDINAGSTGTGTFSVFDNNLQASGTALDIQATAGSAVAIRAFHDNVVDGNSATAGINVSGSGVQVLFDAVAGGGVDAVPGGTTVIGTPGNRIGGAGLTLSNVMGALNFANAASGTIAAGDLDIFSDSGAALSVTAGAGGFDIDVTPNVGILVANAGPAAVLSGTTGVDLQWNSLTSNNSAATGVSLTNVTGTFSAPSGSSITSAGTTDFVISGGTATVTYGGTITDDVGQLVNVASTTGGTKSFTGAITDGDDGDGSGISLSSNTGATITFSGGLVLNTGANPAFAATGGGTLAVCDEDPCNPGATGLNVNKITTTTGVALNVTATTIGANNLEFRSISAGTAASGPANGIVLNNTGASGGLKVKGTGPDGSGGTIQRCSSRGAEIISSNNLSLEDMNFTTNGTAQTVAGSATSCGGDLRAGNNLACVANIYLQTVNTVVLDNLNVTGSGQMGINGNGVTAFTMSNSSVTGNGNEVFENGLTFQNLTGTCAITDSIIKNNASRQIHIGNIANSTSLTLSITGTRTNNAYPTMDTSTTMIGNDAAGGANTQQAILLETFGGSNVNATFNASGVVFNNNLPGNAIDLQPIAVSGALGGTLNNCSFDTNAGGVIISAQLGSGGTYDVTNTEFNRTALQSILYAAANPTTGTLQGTVQNNTIGTAGQSGSACFPTSGANCHGIDVNFIGGTGAIRVKISGNTVQQFDGSGISLRGNGAGHVHAKIQNNIVQNPLLLAAHGIDTNMGTTAGATIDGCVDMTGNTISGTWEDPGVGTQLGIVTNVRFLSHHILPGYGGSSTAVGGPGNAVTDFIIANNTTASKVFTQRGGSGDYPGGGACTTPP